MPCPHRAVFGTRYADPQRQGVPCPYPIFMGEIRQIQPVKLICGLLAAGRAGEGQTVGARQILGARHAVPLQERFGPVDRASEVFPFDFTGYYDKEMGKGILRRFLSFEKLIDPGELAGIKIETNRLEEALSEGGKRTVNLDPGYLDLSKLVLATTKDATYRVYLGRGIYAQSTYYFQDGSYRPWEWTYADYRTPAAIDFFNRVRGGYKRDLKREGPAPRRRSG